MDTLSTNTTSHVKILAFQFISLTKQPSSPPLISRAEFVGIVVAVNRRPHFLNFLIDDGTGCIPCILWLNHLESPYFSRHSPSDVRLLADAAARHASAVRLGALARVRGRITAYRVLQKVFDWMDK
ncbi:CST complex subunit STN1 [Magnolia sinica]|uniref:CST complex subunit STN1 n=1 Tax=Magnolia sinica TaxID=86752 RepID=UPI002657D5F8|nr:CST complex subunit STN1 [Magnolia sinica]